MGAALSSSSIGSSFLSSIHHEPFIPTAQDIAQAAYYLSRPGLLPPELALVVLDYAEYWTQEVTESKRHVGTRSHPTGQAKSLQVLVTPRIGSTSEVSNCVRRLTVTLESRDQGFSDFPQYHGTREASSSWFDVALIRPVPASTTTPSLNTDSASPPIASSAEQSAENDPTSDSPPSSSLPSSQSPPPPTTPTFRTIHRTHLLHNLHAVRNFTSSTVVFSIHSNTNLDVDGNPATEGGGTNEIIALARKGDRYVVYANAQYPGWSCESKGCKVVVECMI